MFLAEDTVERNVSTLEGFEVLARIARLAEDDLSRFEALNVQHDLSVLRLLLVRRNLVYEGDFGKTTVCQSGVAQKAQRRRTSVPFEARACYACEPRHSETRRVEFRA